MAKWIARVAVLGVSVFYSTAVYYVISSPVGDTVVRIGFLGALLGLGALIVMLLVAVFSKEADHA